MKYKVNYFLSACIFVLAGIFSAPSGFSSVAGAFDEMTQEEMRDLEPAEQAAILDGTAFLEGLKDLPEVATLDVEDTGAEPPEATLLTHPLSSQYDPATGHISTTYKLPDGTYRVVTRNQEGKVLREQKFKTMDALNASKQGNKLMAPAGL